VPKRIAVLASGSGSSLDALFSYLDGLGHHRSGTVALVASNRPDARVLERARVRGVATAALGDPNDVAPVRALLDHHGIDLIVLAGYLKLVPAAIVGRFRGRMMNVHPSLLPDFGGPGMYGIRVHRAVIASGVRTTGATVHFVDERFDHGPIIAQWPVPLMPDDTPESLALRVLRVEHALYPRLIDAVAGGRITLDAQDRVRLSPEEAAFIASRGQYHDPDAQPLPAHDGTLDR
jgi:formyltetrahydrofolate-dependent phosphoribosylglycinamide formyltransferase